MLFSIKILQFLRSAKLVASAIPVNGWPTRPPHTNAKSLTWVKPKANGNLICVSSVRDTIFYTSKSTTSALPSTGWINTYSDSWNGLGSEVVIRGIGE